MSEKSDEDRDAVQPALLAAGACAPPLSRQVVEQHGATAIDERRRRS
jgi:hypothetical protein